MRYATAAAKFGSLRKAALALGVKQSTLSRTIAQMEARLGIDLFNRTSGGVHLTRSGAGIIRTCRYLVDAVDLLAERGKTLSRGTAGQLTIGFYTSLSMGNFRASLTVFASRFPAAEIYLVEASRSQLLSDLEGGMLDIAIVTREPDPGKDSSMVLWTERIMAALSEAHPLTINNIIHWTDLKDEVILQSKYDPGPEIQNVLRSKLTVCKNGPKFTEHGVSQENIKGLVGAGLGVGLILESGTGATVPGVVCREVRDGTGPSRISFAAHWRSDNHNPVLANFIALLKERYPSPTDLD